MSTKDQEKLGHLKNIIERLQAKGEYLLGESEPLAARVAAYMEAADWAARHFADDLDRVGDGLVVVFKKWAGSVCGEGAAGVDYIPGGAILLRNLVEPRLLREEGEEM